MSEIKRFSEEPNEFGDYDIVEDPNGEYMLYGVHADRIAQLEADLAEAKKVISVVDGLVTAKGRYHTAQWYQKMVAALDEYKASVKEQVK